MIGGSSQKPVTWLKLYLVWDFHDKKEKTYLKSFGLKIFDFFPKVYDLKIFKEKNLVAWGCKEQTKPF